LSPVRIFCIIPECSLLQGFIKVCAIGLIAGYIPLMALYSLGVLRLKGKSVSYVFPH
jgi:hypothetical protein